MSDFYPTIMNELNSLMITGPNDEVLIKGAKTCLEVYGNTSDLKESPASSYYHANWKGGLLEHSWNVYTNLKHLNSVLKLGYSPIIIFLAGIFHDLCKVNTYKTVMKNVKVDDKWVQEERYVHNGRPSLGHGEESVCRLLAFIPTCPAPVLYAIRYHMGAYNQSDISDMAIPLADWYLVYALQMADMMATYWDEGDLGSPFKEKS